MDAPETQQELGLFARVLTTLTSAPLLPIVSVVHGLLLATVVVVYLGSLPPTPAAPETGDLVTGDFFGIYLGGRIVAEGNGRRLYDHALHREVTASLTGPDYPNEHWVAYPPGYAVFGAIFGGLPWRSAFYVHDLILIGLAFLTVLLLRPVLPELWRRSAWLTVLLTFSFHPVLRTLIGGQNTTLTLFLLAGMTWGLLRQDARGSVVAGVFLGLLTYKPQYVFLPGLFLLARRDVRALGAAAAVGLLHYGVGAWLCGPAWPLDMLRLLGEYQAWERGANFGTHVSLLSVCEHLLPATGARAVTGVLSLVGCAGLVVACVRAGDDAARLRRVWALTLALNLLLSPHTQYYDVGLIVLPVLLLLDEQQQRGQPASLSVRLLLLVGFLAYPIYQVEASWKVPQPLVLWPLLAAVWAARSGPSLLEERPDAVRASQ